MIRSWKRSYSGHIQAWPSESIIAKVVEYMVRLDPTYTHTSKVSDGEMVAHIVSNMREDIPDAHQAFIAIHLRLVDGKRHPKSRDYQLAKMLGIAPRTLRARQKRGFEYVRDGLDKALDTDAAFFV